MERALEVVLLAHPLDGSRLDPIKAGFESAGVEVRWVPLSARAALSDSAMPFATLVEDSAAIVAIATDLLFEDLYALDFLACLAKRRPLCFLLDESIPIPLGFGDAYVVLLPDIRRLGRRDFRSLARQPRFSIASAPERIGSRWSRLRPILINRQRLIELAEPQFRRAALLVLTFCCLLPLAVFMPMYLYAVVSTNGWEDLRRGFVRLLFDFDRLAELVMVFGGAGILVGAMLLMFQTATSRELSWRSSAISRGILNAPLWAALVACVLFAFLFQSTVNVGNETYTDGLPFFVAPALNFPSFAVTFFLGAILIFPISTLLVLCVRYATRGIRVVRALQWRMRVVR